MRWRLLVGRRGTAVAAVRVAVGAALVARPDLATGGDPQRRILVRTIGVRDVVLGCGGLLARRHGGGAERAWRAAGLASDVGDVAVALASRREVGVRGTLAAAAPPLPMIAAGWRGLR